MKILMLVLSAACAYLIAGINPAIILSNKIYHKDIRECGSKNPGFTNFKRCFGMKWASVVMILDLVKSALPTVVFGVLFGKLFNMYQLGVVYTCFFAMLGHAYPVWYRLKGGKGFLVCLASMWVLDWKIGAIATLLMIVLLAITRYMSLSTMLAMASCPVTLAVIGYESLWAEIICILCVVFMIYRHKGNIVRLVKREESKFSFKSKKQE